MVAARSQLTGLAHDMESHLTANLDLALKGLNISVRAALEHSRTDLEAKMSGHMARLTSEIGAANSGSVGSAHTLHVKVGQLEAAGAAADAATDAQVAAVSHHHAALEAQASMMLAHVKDSLSHAKVRSCCLRALHADRQCFGPQRCGVGVCWVGNLYSTLAALPSSTRLSLVLHPRLYCTLSCTPRPLPPKSCGCCDYCTARWLLQCDAV